MWKQLFRQPLPHLSLPLPPTKNENTTVDLSRLLVLWRTPRMLVRGRSALVSIVRPLNHQDFLKSAQVKRHVSIRDIPHAYLFFPCCSGGPVTSLGCQDEAKIFLSGTNSMHNSFTLCSTLFSTDGKTFFKGTCAPCSYGPIQ